MDDPNVVSPGILGFLAFFFLAVALYLLLRNMNGHLRRMRYRAEQLEAEQAPPSGQQPATSEPGQEHEPEHKPEPEATPGPKPDGDTDRAG